MARRFFYDTEFIEYPPRLKDGRSRKGTIDLISIGIVSEEGKAFYAINSHFDPTMANQWVTDNVLSKLPERESPEWMSLPAIKKKVLDFLRPSEDDPVELWAYYADYDHVALCWLFGAMIELPEGMPMLTMDLKQLAQHLGDPDLPEQGEGEHDALEDAKWNLEVFKVLQDKARESDIVL